MEYNEVWKRDEVDSPCVKLCVMHPTANICMGCFRTVEEISDWSAMDPESRKSLMLELPSREKQIVKRRKKRGQS